jgi:hypothetical protein
MEAWNKLILKALRIMPFCFLTAWGCTHTAQQADLDCQFLSSESGELETVSRCAEGTKNGLSFQANLLGRLNQGTEPICVQVKIGSAWEPFYVLPSGRYARTVPYDNGCDYFAEGLARTIIDGKAAYFDRSLEIKIRTDYEWAFPFSDGEALVCRNVVWKRAGESNTMSQGECARMGASGVLLSAFKDHSVTPK